MKNSALIFILSVFLTNLSYGQDAKVFTLDEAVEYALANSNQIRNKQINIADAEQQIVERRAIGIPQVNATIGYNYFIDLPTSLVPAQFFDPMAPEGEFGEIQFGTTNSLEAKIQASALIFDGSYFVGLRAAKEARSYAADQLAQTEQELKQQVKDAYYPALIIQSSLNTLQKNITNTKKLRAETQALVEAGFAELLDVDRLDLSIANIESEVENLNSQVELSYNYLKFLMGYPIEDSIVINSNIEDLLEEVEAEDLMGAVSFANRADYRVLERVMTLNTLNVELMKQAYLPSLSGFASFSYTGQGNNLFKDPFWFPTSIVGLQANIPIFSGFQRQAKVKRAEFQLETFANQQDELERAIFLEVSNARTTYSNAKRRVEIQTKNIELAQRIYDTAQIKYKEGVGSSLEINSAETSLFATQQNYNQALFELLTAKSALDKALGK